MKPLRKFLCAATLALLPFPAIAQISLAGNSYVQDFNGIGAGLPAGWSISKFAFADTLGSTTFIIYQPNLTAWNVNVTGSASATAPSDNWRNISSNNIASSSGSSTQAVNANRAVGWRPGSSSTRNGAFTLAIADTSGLQDFNLSFSLFCPYNGSTTLNQTYVLEYSVGPTLNFIQVGPTYTSGTVFGNFTFTADALELNALNDQAGPVYFRVRGTSTSGTSSSGLDLIGIDDFTLTYAPAVPSAPAFVHQPVSKTVLVGDPVVLSVTTTGTPAPSIQWHRNGAAISGATNRTLMIANAALTDSGEYTVVATNSVATATSVIATLVVVSPAPPTFTTQPIDQTVLIGGTVSFGVTSAGNPVPTVTWEKDDIEIPGAVGATLTFANVTAADAGSYRAIATNSVGTITSNPAVLTVNQMPVITSQPLSRSVAVGDAVVFNVSATGDPAPTFQWRKNGSDILNATAATYTLPSIVLTDAGSYSVVASNLVGSVTSESAQLSVHTEPAPTIISLSSSRQIVALRQGVTLSVTVTSEVSPSFQWNHNGRPVAGATESEFRIESAAMSDNGWYQVFVTNDTGTTCSSVIFVNVVVDPAQIRSWGSNAAGQAAIPEGLDQFVGLAAGRNHSAAWFGDGSVQAWGSNAVGQTSVPAGLSDVVGLAANGHHTLALRASGAVVAWGSNESDESTPPADLRSVVAIAAGDSHSMALRADGTVVAWGSNLYGETTVPVGLNDVVALAAGYHHSVALKADGTVVAWGYSVAGRVPMPAGLTDVRDIAAGDVHILALKADGTIVAWGDDYFNQISVPKGLTDVVAITAGNVHSLALKADGTVVTWGSRFYGEQDPPEALAGVLRVTLGGNHSMVLRSPVDDAPPVITTPPVALTAPYGESVTFKVEATGSPAPGYQWYQNGLPIIGASQSSYTIDIVTRDKAGDYSVVVTNLAGSVTSASAVLTVTKATAFVQLSGLEVVYDGTPRSVVATTDPTGLAVTVTYDGNLEPPVSAGYFSVHAIVDDADYFGSISGILKIDPVPATITLTQLSASYDGATHPVGVTTDPAGLAVLLTYDGSAAAPVNAGSYAVAASFVDHNYSGTATGTLVIGKATAAVTLGSLNQVYDGNPRPVIVATVPAGLEVQLTYNGNSNPPVFAGEYAVAASVIDPNYAGMANGVLAVSRAIASVTLGDLKQIYDGKAKAASVTTTPANLDVIVTYNGGIALPILPGTYIVDATVNDPNYVGGVTDELAIEAAVLVRHAPTFAGNGEVAGSLQMLKGENVSLSGNSGVIGHLLVPGLPRVATYENDGLGGILDLEGDPLPSDYEVRLSGNTLVQLLLRRVDPIALPIVSMPSAPSGTRDVMLNLSGESLGDFATLRDLTIGGSVGLVSVPSGSYGRFAAHGNAGFVLGVAGAAEPAVYELENLTLSGLSRLEIIGPVVLTVRGDVSLSGSAQISGDTGSFIVGSSGGGLYLNGNTLFQGKVVTPLGVVSLADTSVLLGSVVSDRFTISGDAILVQPKP